MNPEIYYKLAKKSFFMYGGATAILIINASLHFFYHYLLVNGIVATLLSFILAWMTFISFKQMRFIKAFIERTK